MLETIMLVGILGFSAALALGKAAEMFHVLSVQAEARSLSRLADAARNHAARDPTRLMQAIRLDPSRRVLFSAADLAGTGSLLPGEELRTARRRDVTLAAAAASADPSEDRILVLAWTAAPAAGERAAHPRAGAGISNTGRAGSGLAVDGCGTGRICGPGISLDAGAVPGLLSPAPPAGAMVSLRMVHMAADRDPYLYRADVGEPLVNRVEGGFDLHGHQLSGASSGWEAGELQVGGNAETVEAAEFRNTEIAGRTVATGNVAAGALVAARSSVGGEAVFPAMMVTGLVTAGRLIVADELVADSWAGGAAATIAVEAMDVAGRLTLTGALRIEDSWPPGSPLPADPPRLAASRADVSRSIDAYATGNWGQGLIEFEIADVDASAALGGRLRLDRGGTGLIERLDVSGCTGC